MTDRKPTLEYGRPQTRRRQSIIFDIVSGLLVAYLFALAAIGILWLAGYIPFGILK